MVPGRNRNEENAVAVARRLVSDGIHLVFARDEPVALLNAQTGEVDLAAWKLYRFCKSGVGTSQNPFYCSLAVNNFVLRTSA